MGRRYWSTISIDVDLDDIYEEMSASDLEEMADKLYEGGYFEKYVEKPNKLNSLSSGLDWEDTCDKLASNQLQLTNEEEEIIKKIADRL